MLQKMIRYSGTLAVVLMLCGAAVAAEDAPTPDPSTHVTGSYRLDFVWRELADNNPVSSHSYTMLVNTLRDRGVRGKVGGGSRVPLSGDKGAQYMNLGVNISCMVHEADNALLLDVNADSTGMISPSDYEKSGAPPVLHDVNTEVSSLVPLGKPTVLSSIDDPASKRRYQLEVTITKLK